MSDLPTDESQSERVKLLAEVAGSWGGAFPDGLDSVALIRAMRGDDEEER